MSASYPFPLPVRAPRYFRRRPYRRPATPPDTPCRHCGRPVYSRPRRGLCRHCYADPDVRHQYPYTGCLAVLNGRRLDSPPGSPPRESNLPGPPEDAPR